MKIIYDPKAVAQMEAILDYIHQRSPTTARAVAAVIKQNIDRLADFPYIARASEVPGIRELPIVRYPYIVFYSVNEVAREVNILRVRHTARDPAHHLD